MVKRMIIGVFLFFIVAGFFTRAIGQEQPAKPKSLANDYLVGNWTVEGTLNGKTISGTFSARPRAGRKCLIYNWKFVVPGEEPLRGTTVGGRDPKTGDFVEYAFISNGSHFISRYPGEASDSGVGYGERTGVIDGKDYTAKIKVDRKDKDMFLYIVTSAESEDENLIFKSVKKGDAKKKKTKEVKSSKERQ